jgi:hypothetical protein
VEKVRLRGGAFIYPRPGEPMMQVSNWLRAHGCGLASLRFLVPDDLADRMGAINELDGKPYIHAFGEWVRRCAIVANVRPEYLLLVGQGEQDVLDIPVTERLDPAITVEAVDAVPERWAVGDHYYRDHPVRRGPERILRVRGDRRLFAMCGYGIPDRHRGSPGDLVRYLGVAQQVAECALYARRRYDEWVRGTRVVDLYGDVKVVCEDPEAYCIASYTPSVVVDGHDPKITAPFGDVLTDRPRIASNRGLA